MRGRRDSGGRGGGGAEVRDGHERHDGKEGIKQRKEGEEINRWVWSG